MSNLKIIKRCRILTFVSLALYSFSLHASFIESTMGTAVVNDATATYFNPASLTLLKNRQAILLGSAAHFRGHFSGQSVQLATRFTQTGSSSSSSFYYLPSLYLGIPANNTVTFGLGVITNIINRDVENNSVLRYAESSNAIQDVDLVPAVGAKINDKVSVGAGIIFSYAEYLMTPVSGFPSLNIPDNLTRNDSNSTSWGMDVGLLLKPNSATLIGLDYRSAITYQFSGSSVLNGATPITSNNYHFTFWTPARSVLSISHFVTPKLGFISTVQRVQWSVFDTLNVHNVAAQVGAFSTIIPSVIVPYHMRDTWIVTLGSIYKVTPKWVIRVAGSYQQSPSNGNYQISNGDSIIVGASTGYEIMKNIIIDGGYAHAFISSQHINVATGTNSVTGVNKGYLDSVSLKLTLQLV